MNIVFLDIETTGLDPATHEILEVGMVRRYYSEIARENVDYEEHFSLPISEERADAKALEINKYAERRQLLSLIEIDSAKAAEGLREVLADALVVGNNVQFDLRFIERLIGGTPWYYSPLDLKAWAAGMCGMSKPASTKFIAELADVPLSTDAHTALVDARWNRDVYDKLGGN